ncbi:hypothetical protein J7E88_29860 [Streptomyces sp. ISL-10]|uniref:hypothetical protein n=1 Tax=Streptomyces sp. ISL-10 TaxID=2819172 RepID=UPI001BECF699|nr:hypothetical protein [Streptomyces sp. ISL-10]MBT2369385.1 hypothetical protein [Streptomyces sp. ISL-10]
MTNPSIAQKIVCVGELVFAGILGTLAVAFMMKGDWFALVPAIASLSCLTDGVRRKGSWS